MTEQSRDFRLKLSGPSGLTRVNSPPFEQSTKGRAHADNSCESTLPDILTVILDSNRETLRCSHLGKEFPWWRRYTPFRGLSRRTNMVSCVGSDSHSMAIVVTG